MSTEGVLFPFRPFRPDFGSSRDCRLGVSQLDFRGFPENEKIFFYRRPRYTDHCYERIVSHDVINKRCA